MLKILESCLKNDPQLRELHELDQIIKSNSLPGIRNIYGKPLLH